MRSWVGTSFILVALVTGCQQRPVERAAVSIPVPIASRFDVAFEGSIERLNIQMQLRRDGDKLTGQYFYEKTREETGVPQYLILNGQMRNDGTFNLSEFDESKQTGEFRGSFSSGSVGAEPSLGISGTWSKPGDSKTLPFSASERRFDLGPDLKLKSAEKTEENEKLKYKVAASFPKLEGNGRTAKFNRAVEDLVAGEVHEFKDGIDEKFSLEKKDAEHSDASLLSSSVDLGYEVTAANPDVISILFYIGSDVAGAAHPNSHTLALNYDTKADKVLELADLFKPGADYLKVISDYCIRSLAKRNVSDEEWRQRGAGPKSDNYRSWNLLRGGMLISFDAYQVASYADRPQEVFIPYRVLNEIIKPDGPAASLLR